MKQSHILPYVQTSRQNVRQMRMTGWIVYLSNKIYSQNNLYYYPAMVAEWLKVLFLDSSRESSEGSEFESLLGTFIL